MSRFKIAEAPHKGIRNALSQLSFMAGSIDFTNKDRVSELHALGKDIFWLLREHANDENTVVLPELEKKVPGSSKPDLADHEEIEAMQIKLEKELDDIYNKTIAGKDTMEQGADFYFNLSKFHSRYLMHMAIEETDTAQMLWDNFTDDEIIRMRNVIMARFSFELMLKWQKFILPALSPAQRVSLLAFAKATAPGNIFNAFMDICRQNLPAEDYNDLLNKLNE